MSFVRIRVLIGSLVLVSLAAAAQATPIDDGNNSPSKATLLGPAVRYLNDSLDATLGRPDTVLGFYNPGFVGLQTAPTLPLQFNDNDPTVGNGEGSKLSNIPLQKNGSAYFKITGAPDFDFESIHDQAGKYRVTYQVYAPGAHNAAPVRTVTQTEWVTPNMIDTLWLDPDNSKPDWTGYTVDVTVNNIVGPGSGDSLDFFTFTGFTAGQSVTVQIDAQFLPLLGLFDPSTNVRLPYDMVGNTITGVASASGRIKIGVSGLGDNGFIGEHDQKGAYTLSIVPEPSSVALLGAGGLLALAYSRRRFRR